MPVLRCSFGAIPISLKPSRLHGCKKWGRPTVLCHVTELSTDREGGAGQARGILFQGKLPVEENKHIRKQMRSSGVIF